jgi:hypothetical protein
MAETGDGSHLRKKAVFEIFCGGTLGSDAVMFER